MEFSPSDNVADWLVDMNVNGVTVVRSPFSQARWEEDAYMSVRSFSFPPSTTKMPLVYPKNTVQPFVCDRGTGQGNTDSPTCWNAVFDIALTALSLDSQLRGMEHFATAANGNTMQTSEIGYADDLVSVHGLASEIQRKAEIMSAFCIICGVSLSYKKLRRAVQHWIGPTRPDHHIPMKIYEYGWKPRDIAIKVDGATEFLGGLHDLLHTGIPQAEAAEDIARLHRMFSMARMPPAPPSY